MATLVKWQTPNWNTLQQEVQRLVDGVVQAGPGEWSPRVDTYETDQALVLEFDLPGLKQADVDIRVEKNILSIQGERKLSGETETYHRMERPSGPFHRSFALPEYVDQDKIAARLVDGVLQLTLPRREETKPRQIAIHV